MYFLEIPLYMTVQNAKSDSTIFNSSLVSQDWLDVCSFVLLQTKAGDQLQHLEQRLVDLFNTCNKDL